MDSRQLRSFRSRFVVLLVATITVLTAARTSTAAVVEVTLPRGLTVSADFLPGRTHAQTAVLVLHGFLQTRNNATVATLKAAAADAGYSVLVPTLSLGISSRAQALPCEAVHDHTLDGDLDEIDAWLAWLVQRGITRVILAGHSFGSLHALAHVSERRDARVRGIIAVSLVPVFGSLPAIESAGAATLGEYSVSYCTRYIAPPVAYRSYARWDDARMLAALRQLSVPATVILGTDDARVNSEWRTALKQNGARLVAVPGASHFFDNQHEFTLLDEVTRALVAF